MIYQLSHNGLGHPDPLVAACSLYILGLALILCGLGLRRLLRRGKRNAHPNCYQGRAARDEGNVEL
jgi:hypothetical protein